LEEIGLQVSDRSFLRSNKDSIFNSQQLIRFPYGQFFSSKMWNMAICNTRHKFLHSCHVLHLFHPAVFRPFHNDLASFFVGLSGDVLGMMAWAKTNKTFNLFLHESSFAKKNLNFNLATGVDQSPLDIRDGVLRIIFQCSQALVGTNVHHQKIDPVA